MTFIIQIINRFHTILMLMILFFCLTKCDKKSDNAGVTEEQTPQEEGTTPSDSTLPATSETTEDVGLTENTNTETTPTEPDNSPKAIYIFPFDHTEDHINVGDGTEPGFSEDRFVRMIPFLEELKNANPDTVYNNVSEDFPIATFQFYGADAEVYEERNKIMTTKFLDQLKDAEKNNLIEIGYHGAHEPTEHNNPTDSVKVNSTADIPSYLNTFNTFLNTWRHLICGFPYSLPTKPESYESYCVNQVFPFLGNTDDKVGGIHKMTRVFFDSSSTDRLNTISGLNNDIYEIPTIRSFSSRYVAFGFEDHGPCSDNPSGVCGTSKENVEITRDILDKLSPSPKCAYEIY